MPSRAEKQRRRSIAKELGEREANAFRSQREHRVTLKWYFVNTVIPGELEDPNHELEIQILNADGEARAYSYCRRDSAALGIDGEPVPPKVLDAARRLTIGLGGQYVDAQGNLLSFRGEPLEWPQPPSPEAQAADQILDVARRLYRTGVPGWRERLQLLLTRYPGTPASMEAARMLKELN